MAEAEIETIALIVLIDTIDETIESPGDSETVMTRETDGGTVVDPIARIARGTTVRIGITATGTSIGIVTNTNTAIEIA